MGDIMDFIPYLFGVIFVVVIGRLLFGRLRHGSWTGSFLGGSIDRTVGEIELQSNFVSSQVLKVHAMKAGRNEDDFVAMVVVAKAPLAASMQPIKLSRLQAGHLAAMLQDAAR
jgi:hypothetical protein